MRLCRGAFLGVIISQIPMKDVTFSHQSVAAR
jgi:hypothetical protein